MSEQQDTDYKNTSYEFTAKCLVKGFKMPPDSERIFCECAVLAGNNPDRSQRYLNASLIVSEKLIKFVQSLLDIDLNNMPMYFTIGNFYCEPALGEQGEIWKNYRGFLNGLSVGKLPKV